MRAAPVTWLPAGLRRLGVLTIIAACAGGAAGGDSIAAGETPVDSSRAAGTPDAPFEGTMGRTDNEGSADSVATLATVRTARHATFERVVFEFRDEVPGYHVAYESGTPAHCGSGDAATVRGSAYLEIRMAPARAHEFFGERAETTVRDRNRAVDYQVLKQLVLTCDFEANVTWVLGLDARRPYRIMTLENPPRLVLDVQGAREE